MIASRLSAGIAGLIALAAALAPAPSALAAGDDVATVTAFGDASTLSVPFGGDWVFDITVTAPKGYQGTHVDPNDGTVDVLVSGQPDDFAKALPIYPGGVAYFSQPDTQPLLPPGTYTLTAIFTPATNGTFATSKTTKTAKLTITELSIAPAVSLVADSTVPTVRTSLSGSFIDTTGAPPAGTWTVSAQDKGGSTVFEKTVDQPTVTESGTVGPLDIPITGALEPGETYAVTAEFTPATYLAGGLTIENAAPLEFTTAPPTIAETLNEPLALPLWALATLGALLLAALALVIVLVVRRARTSPKIPEVAAIPRDENALEQPVPTAALEAPTAETTPQG
jgi:hypothetical protein